MKKIKSIVTLVMLLLILPTAMASEQTINLCEKTINIGNSWGVCNPSDTSMAQGTFTYNTIGSTLIFSTSASGLSTSDGTSYTLIYYKDSDTEHVLPSTKLVNILSSANSLNGAVTLSGNLNIGDIPASDDVNIRGKIWIVPTSELNSDNTLKWTGYGNGLIMDNYLFESDSIVQEPDDGLTVQDRMGGIIYTIKSPGTVTRTMDKDYLRIGDTGGSIIVTLTGVGVTDAELSVWGAIETTNANVDVTTVTPKTDVEGNNPYSFATLDGNVLEYKLTLKSGASVGTYLLSGTFIDSNTGTGVISPDMNIRILPDCLSDPVCYYDTNGIDGIQKPEIITAVKDYFEYKLTLEKVLLVVRAYLGL